MLRAYKYSDEVQDALESVQLYVGKKEDESEDLGVPLLIEREGLEEYVRAKFMVADLEYRVIRRKKTTSFVTKLANGAGELEDVKVTIRYDDEGKYVDFKLVNVTFDRDLDFYVEQAELNKRED